MNREIWNGRVALNGQQWLAGFGVSKPVGWLLVGGGAALVLVGMALQMQSPGALVLVAIGLILIGMRYVSQQLTGGVSADARAWTEPTEAGDARVQPDQEKQRRDARARDSRAGALLFLAALLWSALMLVIAVVAIAWGDLAGLIAACTGGFSAILVLLAARRHLQSDQNQPLVP